MANITGYVEHPQNPGWVALTFDNGQQSPFAQDPDGSFRKQATEVAAKLAPPLPAPAAPIAMPSAAPEAPSAAPSLWSRISGAMVPGPAQMAGASPVMSPDPGAEIATDRTGPGVQARFDAAHPTDPGAPERLASYEAVRGPVKGPAVPAGMTAAEREAQTRADAEYASGAQAFRVVQGAPTGGGVSTSTTTQTGGLAPEDRKRVDAANQAAVDAQSTADHAALQARTEQVNAEWMRLSDVEKQKLAEEAMRKGQEADLTAKVDTQTRKMEDLTSRPIDPGRAFKGDAGWYAFMAGFGDSIQNFGAALAGRGPVANPGATIDRMIERSVQQQTQQQEQEFKAGRLTADQLNSERDYVRAQLATVGKQLAETQLGKARTEDENLGLRAMGDKFEADRKAAIARNAAATARTQQVSTTVQKTPQTGGGQSLFLGEKADWDAVKAHSEKQSGADQVERGVGRLEKAAGWTWDEKGNNGAGGYVGSDGKPVTPGSADPAGISILGSRFSTGEGSRELNGALEDMAAGGAKVKDPIGAVSDKSVAAEKDAMAASTDEGILRAAERTRRNLRGMKAGIDAGFSPGTVNASRYRRAAENEFRSNQPGLPRSRAATSEDLRASP